MVYTQQHRSVSEIAADIVSAIETVDEPAERAAKLDEIAREAVHLPSRYAAELYQQLFNMAAEKKPKGKKE